MGKISITIPGNPISKKRPRFKRMGKFVKTYDVQVKEKKAFRDEFLSQYDETCIKDKPIHLDLKFGIKRPKSHFRTGKNSHLIKESAPKLHIYKPDIDNLIKFVMDAMNGIAWKDDCLITSVTAIKGYADVPGTIITFVYV